MAQQRLREQSAAHDAHALTLSQAAVGGAADGTAAAAGGEGVAAQLAAVEARETAVQSREEVVAVAEAQAAEA